MNRKLLPYERGLCQQLGLTEEQYFEFLAAQRDYALSEAQRRETLRAEPVSIILAVVGVVFQVASALLAPKPETPDKKNTVSRRDKSFAPRSGFNGTQELARYGDPINLVYCNDKINPKGQVRVGTSLLWSAVESTGTGQYIQLLLLIGAAKVLRLDVNKTAFGQLPARQFSASNTWVYYSPQNGPVPFSSRVLGDARDPAVAAGGSITHLTRELSGNAGEGYSQAYTPTTSTELGVYAPIPINVDIIERDEDGKTRYAPIGITISGGFASSYSVGSTFTLSIKEVPRKQDEDKAAVAKEAAKDLRLQLVNNLDRGAIYRLGSASFKVRSVTSELSLDNSSVSAQFECTEAGVGPTCRYDRMRAKIFKDEDKEVYDNAKDILKAPVSEPVKALTTADVDSIFSADEKENKKYWIGFTEQQAKERERKSTVFTQPFTIPKFGGVGNPTGGNRDYNFTGSTSVSWTDDLDKARNRTFIRGGSIAYTEELLKLFLANKPKINNDLLRAEYRDDREKLRRIEQQLMGGKAKKLIRKSLIANNAELKGVVARIDVLNDLLSNDVEELNKEWRAEAKTTQPYADYTQRIRDQRELIANLKEADATAKRVSKERDILDEIREQRRDYVADYIAGKRKQLKPTKANLKLWRQEREQLIDKKRQIIADNLDEEQERLLSIVRLSTVPFVLTGVDDERFACGIKCINQKLDGLQGKFTVDQVGVDAVVTKIKELIAEKRQALQWVNYLLKNWRTLIRDNDDAFYVKALVKSAKALYTTVTACNIVRFNFKVRLFRRISGRQKEYGEYEAPDGYKLSDNGLERRTMFFYVLIRKSGDTAFTRVPKLFAVERGNDIDNYISVLFHSSTKAKREFRFIPVSDPVAEIRESGYSGYAYIYNAGAVRSISAAGGVINYFGKEVALDFNSFPDLRERGPIYTNEWDLFSNSSDTQVQSSYDNGPEAKLVNVTEQTICPIAGKYQNMSLLAFHTYASNGVEDLRSITAFVQEGKAAWKVADDGSGPFQSGEGTCYAPDIFADTVLDATNGIKNFANSNAVDWERLALAKRFCKNNGLGVQLFMDGVIADRRGWREFWVEVAPYSLLEFARMNGKETLIPALPVTSAGAATTSLTISAMFNEGNILEDSYREEYLDFGDNTKDLIATVVYREITNDEIFPRDTSVTLCRSDTDLNDAVWQTFDLSDWVSQREQAVLYARYLCQQRRYVRRTVEFKTYPTESPIQPGSYIFVDIGLDRWDTVRTGVVEEGGVLSTPLGVELPDGSFTVMTYDSVNPPVVHQDVVILNGVAQNLSVPAGNLFVLGTNTNGKRVFRVTDVSLSEEAEVTVRAVEHPSSISGGSAKSLVADLSAGLFREIGVDCS
jgi:hypothetical protein